jgi:hypothetical protein
MDYLKSCDAILSKFDEVAVDLAKEYGPLPGKMVYGTWYNTASTGLLYYVEMVLLCCVQCAVGGQAQKVYFLTNLPVFSQLL